MWCEITLRDSLKKMLWEVSFWENTLRGYNLKDYTLRDDTLRDYFSVCFERLICQTPLKDFFAYLLLETTLRDYFERFLWKVHFTDYSESLLWESELALKDYFERLQLFYLMRVFFEGSLCIVLYIFFNTLFLKTDYRVEICWHVRHFELNIFLHSWPSFASFEFWCK